MNIGQLLETRAGLIARHGLVLAVALGLAMPMAGLAQDAGPEPDAPALVETAPTAPQTDAAPQETTAQDGAPQETGAQAVEDPAAAAPLETAPADPAPAQAPADPLVPEIEDAAPAPGETAIDLADPALPASAPAGGTLPMVETGMGHDLSPWGMFMMADIVVKAVMIGLVIAAAVTWIIFFAKWLQLWGAKARARHTLRVVSAAESLSNAVMRLDGRRGIAPTMVRSADEEMRNSADLLGQVSPAGIKERISSRLARIEAAAGRKISQGTGVLASIGSVAPFVGLFGTVWGVMNSFIGIAESQTTNLAVVAPGIAEALLATGIGLVAAIPAVVIYNGFARSITGYRQLLADVAAGIERLVSRDIDRHAVANDNLPRAAAAE